MADDMHRSLQGCRPAAEAAAAMFVGSRQEKSQQAFARLAQIQNVLFAVQRGQLCERQAVQEIEQIAAGWSDAIVRVGQTHRPDIQTTREGDR